MPIVLDHTIVPCRDKAASARFFAALMGVSPSPPEGPFVPVRVNAELAFDFDDRGGPFEPHHYGFRVDDATFDDALARLKASGATFGSGPAGGWDGEIDRSGGGRRIYVRDDNGHTYELFTRP